MAVLVAMTTSTQEITEITQRRDAASCNHLSCMLDDDGDDEDVEEADDVGDGDDDDDEEEEVLIVRHNLSEMGASQMSVL